MKVMDSGGDGRGSGSVGWGRSGGCGGGYANAGAGAGVADAPGAGGGVGGDGGGYDCYLTGFESGCWSWDSGTTFLVVEDCDGCGWSYCSCVCGRGHSGDEVG